MNWYTVFQTDAGFAAIAWRGDVVTSFRLPASTEEAAEHALLKRLPDAVRSDPPPAIARLIGDIVRYFAGEDVNFSSAPLDLGDQEPVFDRIYRRVRALGRGETTTYGTIAKELGLGPEFARDVGQAMAHNPIPLIVPCHRVLGAGGKIGGFSAPGGSETKKHMLALEGVAAGQEAPVEPDRQHGFNF